MTDFPTTKEGLQALLRVACELEHQLMTMYLYTGFSLKQNQEEEGFSPKEGIRIVNKWQGQISQVAVQEMLHLTLANNLLVAIGGKPHFSRPNLPCNHSTYPSNFELNYWNFSQETMQWFVALEAFNENDLCSDCSPDRQKIIQKFKIPPIEPSDHDHAETLGVLYENVVRALLYLSKEDPEKLFDNPGYQMNEEVVSSIFDTYSYLGKKYSLVTDVVDLESAMIAINTIIVQGEGDVNQWNEFLYKALYKYPEIVEKLTAINAVNYHNNPKNPSHETMFCNLLADTVIHENIYKVASRNVLNNPCTENSKSSSSNLITNQYSASVVDLFNNNYQVMIAMLEASFLLENDEIPYSTLQYKKASFTQAAIRMMTANLRPLGCLITQLPADENVQESTHNAGPNFFMKPNTPSSSFDMENIICQLRELARQATELANSKDELAQKILFTTPDYAKYQRITISDFLKNSLAPNLRFYAYRLEMVFKQESIEYNPAEAHVCRGLNSCKGKGLGGSGTSAGDGNCATAWEHICVTHNLCKNQGGCGASSTHDKTPLDKEKRQNHPGSNTCETLGACSSPILPASLNTLGKNTNPELHNGGDESVYSKAEGNVWTFARMIFEKQHDGNVAPYDESQWNNE